MKYSLIPFALCIVIPFYGQVLFEKDSSGFELATQFSINKRSTLIAVGSSLTLGGRILLGLAIGREFAHQSDDKSTAVRPSLGYIPIKQNEKVPFSIVTYLAYQDNASRTKEFNAISFEYGIGIVPRISGDVDLFPGIYFGWGKSRLKHANFIPREPKSTSLAFDLTFLFGKVYIDPLVAIRKEGTSFSIAMGLLH